MSRSAYLPRLHPRPDEALYVALARSVADDVRTGVLGPGQRLPGTRSLARGLGVDRSTVIAAWRDLEAQGWIEGRQGSGTYVAELGTAPLEPARWTRDPDRVGFALGPAPPPALHVPPKPGSLVLYGGHPELRDWPVAELARAYRRALERRGAVLLDYGDPRGEAHLRAALAKLVTERRGLLVGADDVLLTRGSQMALDLCARALLKPGDVVAVERLGYRPAWRALAGAGARLAAVPVDEGGLDIDALDRLCQVEAVRAVYVTPHHQYPTGASLDAGRRVALLELARRHRFAVLEDDYDNEFHYEGRPIPPLVSLDRHGVVIYIGTLSKALAPGLRTGFVVAPRPVLEVLTSLRIRVDRQGDQVLERALAELLEDGTVRRHIRKRQKLYLARREALCSALQEHLASVVLVRRPPGGLALWLPVRPPVDVDRWTTAAYEHGVYMTPGSHFTFDGERIPFLRLGFARSTAEELHEAVRRLAAALPTG